MAVGAGGLLGGGGPRKVFLLGSRDRCCDAFALPNCCSIVVVGLGQGRGGGKACQTNFGFCIKFEFKRLEQYSMHALNFCFAKGQPEGMLISSPKFLAEKNNMKLRQFVRNSLKCLKLESI